MTLTIQNVYLQVINNIRPPIPLNLHPNEYTQGLRYYRFAVNLNRCNGSCNTLSDLPNRIRVPNKTKDLNLNVFDMITGINESEILTKHVSCECKFNFHGTKCNVNKTWNNDRCKC